MNLLPSLIFVFLLTLIIEYIVIIILIRKNFLELFITAVLINAFTNPLANYLYLIHDVPILPIEAGVFIVEALLLKLLLSLKPCKAVGLSFIINTMSTLFGSFIMHLLWYIYWSYKSPFYELCRFLVGGVRKPW